MGVVVIMGGVTIAIGPSTGPLTKVTVGADAGVGCVPLGPSTKGLGGTASKFSLTAIDLTGGMTGVAGSDPTPQPDKARHISIAYFISVP